MKVLLLGDTGSLGKQLKALFVKKKIKFFSVNRKKFKIIDYSLLKSLSLSYKPNLIINCVAMTGLIFCENKKQEAFKINTSLPLSILKIRAAVEEQTKTLLQPMRRLMPLSFKNGMI